MKKKIDEFVKLAVKWNRKEITGDKFASAFWAKFEKECLIEWNKVLNKE